MQSNLCVIVSRQVVQPCPLNLGQCMYQTPSRACVYDPELTPEEFAAKTGRALPTKEGIETFKQKLLKELTE